MRIAGIAPIGFSPPVITEFIQYLYEVKDEKLRDLVLIATSHNFVKAGVYLVIEALKDRYPKVRVHPIFLNFEDVNDEDKMYEFLKISCNALVDQKLKYKSDIIHLCISGGRKEETALLTLLAQLVGVNTVMHFIISDVKTFNEEIERLKKDIENILEADDKESYYKSKKDRFDKLMYPELSFYSAIEIPILPYPKEELSKIMKLLKSKKPFNRFNINIDEDILRKLSLNKLVRLGSKRIYILEKGQKFSSALSSIQKLL
ncbi:hypothetical protein HRbin06_00893 [archaeon HR06]|nr:hypothetical protein HRbin06_00893 [archaeon HR06]